MNIGFDIDDTLTDLKKYNKKIGKKYFKQTGKTFKVANKKAGFIGDMYNWTKEEFEEFWHKIKQHFLENLPMRKDAELVLNTLKKQGHNIFIISRRFSNNPYERSERWLKKHNLPYNKLIVRAGDKIEACKQNNIDFFIDDDIKTCDNLNKNGIKSYVINNYFNIDEKSSSPRVGSLKEFLQIVLQHEKEPEL